MAMKQKFKRDRTIIFGSHSKLPENSSRVFIQQYVNSSFSGRGVNRIVANGGTFYRCLFSVEAEGVAFANCSFISCRFQYCKFSVTLLKGCDFADCSFDSSDFGTDIRVSGCSADETCRFVRSLPKSLFERKMSPVLNTLVDPFDPIDGADDDDDDYAALYGGYGTPYMPQTARELTAWEAVASSGYTARSRKAVLICRSLDDFEKLSV